MQPNSPPAASFWQPWPILRDPDWKTQRTRVRRLQKEPVEESNEGRGKDGGRRHRYGEKNKR